MPFRRVIDAEPAIEKVNSAAMSQLSAGNGRGVVGQSEQMKARLLRPAESSRNFDSEPADAHSDAVPRKPAPLRRRSDRKSGIRENHRFRPLRLSVNPLSARADFEVKCLSAIDAIAAVYPFRPAPAQN